MKKVQGFGRVLPSLLVDAVNNYPDIPRFYQWKSQQWQDFTPRQLQSSTEELAWGLLRLGLHPEDKIALLLHSDIDFVVADMGTLLAGLVNIPIDLTQTIENIIYVLNHTQAKALIIADLSLLNQISPYLTESTALEWLIVVDVGDNLSSVVESDNSPLNQNIAPLNSSVCLQMTRLSGEKVNITSHITLPKCLQVMSLAQVQQQGKQQINPESWQRLLNQLQPQKLATIIYVAGDSHQPNGVMLTHENIVTNVLTSFDSFPGINQDNSEIALSFLPLTHIFARSFFYGHLYSGHQVYFSHANYLMRHLAMVKPTILITVPLLLEKISQKIINRGHKLRGWRKWLFTSGIYLAKLDRINQTTYCLIQSIVSRIFQNVSSLLGGNLKVLISGGAKLNPTVANLFTAMGIPLIQGYGLTETSGVVAYTQNPSDDCAHTVGKPIIGVELKIAEDGEVLVKSPFNTIGYYRDSGLTKRILNHQKWLHTGDLGIITDDNILTLTGVKKAHFKLSTGKYVSVLPLQNQLQNHPLIKKSIVLAPNYKFCSVLIFPDRDNLLTEAKKLELNLTIDQLLTNSCILVLYQKLIDQTNCHLPYWSHIRKFKLINKYSSYYSYAEIIKQFQAEIDEIYHQSHRKSDRNLENTLMCPTIEAYSCPAYAKSIHY